MERELLTIIENLQAYNEEIDGSTYESSFYNDLDRFIKNKLSNPLFKAHNINILLKHIDKILECTSSTNIDWLLLDDIVNNSSFLNLLTENINHFPYKDSYKKIFDMLLVHYKTSPDVLFSNKMIDNLLKDNKDNDLYQNMFEIVSEDRRMYILSKFLENKKDIAPLTILDIEENEVNFIEEHIDEFLNNATDLLNLRKHFLYYEKNDTVNRINDYINNHPEKIGLTMLSSNPKFDVVTDESDKELISGLLGLITKDIADSEKCNISDIEHIGGGAFSNVFGLNDKIIKLSTKRSTFNFKNNPYILAPLLRKQIELSNNQNIIIEVTEKALVDYKASEEELYELYKNLREEGLIWTDIQPANVGRLLKDNTIHWKDEINPSDEILNFDERTSDKILSEGELVIIDSDFIYDENDPNIIPGNQFYQYQEFEERYKNEKNNDMKRNI